MSAQAALAEIGHNSASVGQMVEAEPAIIYRDDSVLPSLLQEIEAEIAAASAGVDTKRGRETIASLAHSISRRKTPIVAAGKALTEDWRKKTATVNAIKSKVEADFDALRDKARAPLDAWEAAERSRTARVETAISTMNQAINFPASYRVENFDEDIEMIERIAIDGDFAERKAEAEDIRASALEALRAGRTACLKAEEERAELARLRAAEEERQRAAREEEARQQAETADRERIQAAERRAAAEAEARVKAHQEAALEEERRKAREAQEALAAEQRRQREEAEARQRAEDEARREQERRQADIAHKGRIMGEAKTAIMTCGVDEPTAKQIVLAICAGSVPHTSIRF